MQLAVTCSPQWLDRQPHTTDEASAAFSALELTDDLLCFAAICSHHQPPTHTFCPDSTFQGSSIYLLSPLSASMCLISSSQVWTVHLVLSLSEPAAVVWILFSARHKVKVRYLSLSLRGLLTTLFGDMNVEKPLNLPQCDCCDSH